MASEEEARHQRWVAAWAGFGIAGIVVAAGYQPVSRFVSPELQWTTFLFISLAVITFYEGWLTSHAIAKKICMVTAVSAAFIAGCFGYAALTNGFEVADANDQRCKIIEVEMMRGSPRRGDLPDMFQAFGCRPQTDIMPRRQVADATKTTGDKQSSAALEHSK